MSKRYFEPLDCNGERIIVGDNVLYVYVSEQLLQDLPSEDQQAIKAQKGKAFTVISIDDRGRVEIEFEYKQIDSEVIFHTIWVKSRHLKKIV